MGDLEDLTCEELVKKLVTLANSGNDEEVDEVLDWLLFTYSPEHSYALVQENADALSGSAFIELVLGKVKDVYEPEIFLETLNVISSIEGTERVLAMGGAGKSIGMMMSKDMHNARAQILACKVLSNLAVDPQVRNFLGRIRIIAKLMESLKKHQSNAEVVVAICRALGQLAQSSPANKAHMSGEKVLDLLVELLNTKETNLKVTNEILRAMRNIVGQGGVQNLQQHMIPVEVMKKMQEHKSISEIQIHALWVLTNIVTGSSELKDHAVTNGVVENTLAAMDLHRIDTNVQHAGAVLLGLICKQASHRQTIVQKRGITTLMSAMKTHRSDVATVRAVLKALFRLAFNAQVRDKLAHEKIVGEVVEVMKLNAKEGPLQRQCIIFLLQLVKTKSLLAVAQKEAVSTVIAAMNSFAELPQVAEVAQKAVTAFVSGGVSAPSAASAKASPSKKSSSEESKSEVSELKHQIRKRDETIKELKERIEKLEKSGSKTKSSSDSKEVESMKSKASELEKELDTVKRQLSEEQEKVKSARDQALSEIKAHKKDEKEKKKKQEETKANKAVVLSELVKGDGKKLRSATPTPHSPGNTPPGSPGSADPEFTSARDKTKPKKKKDDEEKPEKPAKLDKMDSSPKITLSTPTLSPDDTAQKSPKRSHTKKPEKDDGSTSSAAAMAVSPREERSREFKRQKSSTDESVAKKDKRNLKRKEHQPHKRASLTGSNDAGQREVERLKKELDVKEHATKALEEDKVKLENELKRLQMDLKGSQVLIQALQKESVNLTQRQQEAAEANSKDKGGLFSRHQKQVKELKQQVANLETENAKLKGDLKGKK